MGKNGSIGDPETDIFAWRSTARGVFLLFLFFFILVRYGQKKKTTQGQVAGRRKHTCEFQSPRSKFV